ncbi:uracil-xanthine permease [Bacillus sp. MUM 116]|uniref:nucleobase:cation symporter-2 family protein n=1 Tax=Bacillus sp. MUM 116 TaxID=1678002 RepID=UPI0008F5DADF|nr:nucleobase:cation symporter-2 family protein [Bacillus sp. MUM 116]OIK05670.1 uracil-xanthine permease [Bacillus sp. MUM 116]
MKTKSSIDVNAVFNEKLPLVKLLPLGLQHLLTMVGSFMVPVIVGSSIGLDAKTIAYLVSAILLSSGLAILIQVFGIGKGIGSRLPFVMGSSFITLGPMIIIGKQYGLPTLFGSIIASGIIIVLLSFFFDKILLLFPKVVTGTFITIMGITLAPTAFKDFAGGEGTPGYGSPKNIIIGLIVLLTIVLLHKYGKGIIKTLSMLLGVAIGTVIAGFMGMINTSPVSSANWVQVITPFHFGAPVFKVSAIITMTIFCIINLIQCFGSFSVLDEACETESSEKTIVSGLRGQAVTQVVSGLFNSVPHAFLNENIGVMALSGVKSRYVSITTGCSLVILSFLPKFAAAITIIPACVRGGAMLAIFGMVTAAGISILSKVDFHKTHATLIIGTSMSVGVGSNFQPDVFAHMPAMLQMLLSNGLFSASIIAIVLNLCLNFQTMFKLRRLQSEEQELIRETS